MSNLKEIKRYTIQIRQSKNKYANFRNCPLSVLNIHEAKELLQRTKYHYPSHDVRLVIETYSLTKKEILK